MKTFMFLLLAAFVTVSCNKSEDAKPDPPLTSPGMIAKLDGSPVTYGTPSVEKQVSTDGTETIFVSAYTGDGTSIEISLSKLGGIVPDEYDASNAAHIGISAGSDYFSTNKIVNITITSIDATHIVGTFMGEANNITSGGVPRSVTGGKFYVNF
jgi:hypothetical protein